MLFRSLEVLVVAVRLAAAVVARRPLWRRLLFVSRVVLELRAVLPFPRREGVVLVASWFLQLLSLTPLPLRPKLRM